MYLYIHHHIVHSLSRVTCGCLLHPCPAIVVLVDLLSESKQGWSDGEERWSSDPAEVKGQLLLSGPSLAQLDQHPDVHDESFMLWPVREQEATLCVISRNLLVNSEV